MTSDLYQRMVLPRNVISGSSRPHKILPTRKGSQFLSFKRISLRGRLCIKAANGPGLVTTAVRPEHSAKDSRLNRLRFPVEDIQAQSTIVSTPTSDNVRPTVQPHPRLLNALHALRVILIGCYAEDHLRKSAPLPRRLQAFAILSAAGPVC